MKRSIWELLPTWRRIFKNVAGFLLVILGIILSLPFVPGPGFAVILLGLAMADWPFKKRFFHWLHSFRFVQKCDDWLHRRFRVRLPEKPRHDKGAGSVAPSCKSD